MSFDAPAGLSAFDLTGKLALVTGSTSGSVTAVGDDHPERAADPPDFAAAYGKLITVARLTDPTGGEEVVCEIRRRPAATPSPVVVQIGGATGAVEWDVRTGLMRSVLQDGEPRVVSCGRLDQPGEWLLNQLLRRRAPAISMAASVATTRMLLLAELSRRQAGTPQHWSS